MKKATIHYDKYVEYTGWYALCMVDDFTKDGIPYRSTRNKKEVTCRKCKALL